jgi:hypothetical protein
MQVLIECFASEIVAGHAQPAIVFVKSHRHGQGNRT